MDKIEYYNRETKEVCEEIVMGDGFIKWAYQRMSGKILSPLLFKTSILTRLMGAYFNSSFSKSRIKPTINDLNIDMSDFAKSADEFTSFNDFFYREIKPETRPFDKDEKTIVSPSDGRIFVYENINSESKMKVKGAEGSLEEIFNGNPPFEVDKVAVVRLCPVDYHRYHFPCDGEILSSKKVKGDYHSVNPVALAAKPKCFCVNKREYSVLQNKNAKVAIMEVGAFGVAGIYQTYQGNSVKKMDEKGYFDFGGSTVVLLFEKDTIQFSEDLIANSAKGYETLIKVGATIAEFQTTH